ncbi:hypothetical protein HII31_12468 [Pseudocercospora fuligena]|uniref:Uncharacterized protein n=1 Tax=Pseudocercospora fuligena TaxID=685502 RepID=A0A8H6R5D7_9PEZI|nr:hypothetical protein HII31_12468 [Pseudocercospora fuligena]
MLKVVSSATDPRRVAHKIGLKASTIDAFVRACLRIPGFRTHMSKLSYAVTQCFQSLLQSLPESWTPESRIMKILAKPRDAGKHAGGNLDSSTTTSDFDTPKMDSKPTATDSLLQLCRALGATDLPRVLWEECCSPQKRRALDGSVFSTRVSDLHDDYLNAAIGSSHLPSLLSSLEAHEILVSSTTHYSLSRDVPPTLEDLAWYKPALRLLCFVIPREVDFHTRFSSTLHILEPCFSYTWQRFRDNQINLDVEMTAEVVESLLSLSRIGSMSDRLLYAQQARRLATQKNDAMLTAEAIYEESVGLRLKGDYSGSLRCLEVWSLPRDSQVGNRLDAALGRLRVSKLENLVQQENFDAAIDCYMHADWRPRASEHLSPYLLDILAMKTATMTKVWRARSEFDRAYKELELTLKGAKRRNLTLCAMADCLIEMRQPGDAVDLLKPQLTALKEHHPSRTRALRRVNVSIANALVAAGNHAEARRYFTDLVCLKDGADVIEQMLHIRLLCSRAICSQLCDDRAVALQCWKDL